MKKLLITGFEPFGGESINPSLEAVKALPDKIGEYTLTKLLIPVVFGEAAQAVINAAKEVNPDVIISVGLAGGRSAVTPELVGINLRHARIPDNKGNQPKDEPINPGGEAAFFSTLPVRKMSEAINRSGVSSQLSYSAGASVGTAVLYTLLSYDKGSDTCVGFIHVPYSKEQKKEPNMDINDVIKALTVAIENIN